MLQPDEPARVCITRLPLLSVWFSKALQGRVRAWDALLVRANLRHAFFLGFLDDLLHNKALQYRLSVSRLVSGRKEVEAAWAINGPRACLPASPAVLPLRCWPPGGLYDNMTDQAICDTVRRPSRHRH